MKLTAKERINLYKKALADYKICLEKDVTHIMNLNCDQGLCAYFYFQHGLRVYDKDMKRKLPELYKQKPAGVKPDTWWFPRVNFHVKNYAIIPRIICLESAIKLVQKTIKNEKDKIRNKA